VEKLKFVNRKKKKRGERSTYPQKQQSYQQFYTQLRLLVFHNEEKPKREVIERQRRML